MKTKLKTNKSIAKRIRVTGSKKLMRRKQKQNHFNARATGIQISAKRNDLELSEVNKKLLKSKLAYLK